MRNIVLFLIFLGGTCSSFSQDNQEQKSSTSSFILGAIGGLNLSNIVGADVSNNSARLGLHLGVYSQFDFTDDLGFRPELHVISTKGTHNGNFKSTYMDLPLLLTYNVADKFQLLGGFQPSLLLSASVGDGRGNITGLIRTLDLGVVLGGWYEISKAWGVGARLVPGLLRVGASGQERTFNSSFQASVGYRFL